MSLPGSELLNLQAFADGELDGDELAAAEKLVAENDDARAFVESLVVLGHGVRAAEDTVAMPSIDLADAIMAKIDDAPAAAAPSVRPAAAVTSLAAQRERRAQKSQVVVAIGALALAAAGILYLRGRGADDTAKPEVAQVTPSPSASGVEVSDIESNDDKNVSVFYLPASGGNAASSVVVWIDEKGAP